MKLVFLIKAGEFAGIRDNADLTINVFLSSKWRNAGQTFDDKTIDL
jgi:hypothetical protein